MHLHRCIQHDIQLRCIAHIRVQTDIIAESKVATMVATFDSAMMAELKVDQETYQEIVFDLCNIFVAFVHHVQHVSSFTYTSQNNKKKTNFGRSILQFAGGNSSICHAMFFSSTHRFLNRKIAIWNKTQHICFHGLNFIVTHNNCVCKRLSVLLC